MAISSSSLTLQQYAQQSNSPLVRYVVKSLLDTGSVLNDMAFQTNPSLYANGARLQGGLATPNWRKINGSTVTASSTLTPYQEQIYVLSNVIDIDRLIMIDNNAIGSPDTVQVDALLEAWNYDINDKFFNNDHASGNADAMVGIRSRLDNPGTWGTNTACKIDAGGIVITDAGMTSATANNFVKYMQQMLDEMGVPDGTDVVIYMNRNLRRRLDQAIRLLGAGGGFSMVQDAFGRRVETYKNAKIRTVGVKGDQTTEIITNTEDTAGANGSSTYTSMYAVRYGDRYFNGWQMHPLLVQAIGDRPEEPTSYRTFLEWPMGLMQQHTRAIARVYDLKVA